jgi:hypothetical protein
MSSIAPSSRSSSSTVADQGSDGQGQPKPQGRKSRHACDLRFSVPFYFAKYYVVFQVGRDRRAAVEAVAAERRRHGRHALGGVLFGGLMVFLGLMVLLGLLTVAYVVKTMLGIDLFPDVHVWQLLFARVLGAAVPVV